MFIGQQDKMTKFLILPLAFLSLTACDQLLGYSIDGAMIGSVGSSSAAIEDGICDGEFDGDRC